MKTKILNVIFSSQCNTPLHYPYFVENNKGIRAEGKGGAILLREISGNKGFMNEAKTSFSPHFTNRTTLVVARVNNAISQPLIEQNKRIEAQQKAYEELKKDIKNLKNRR